jgi:hypothetical protein
MAVVLCYRVRNRYSILQYNPQRMQQTRHVNQQREHDVKKQVKADTGLQADRQGGQEYGYDHQKQFVHIGHLSGRLLIQRPPLRIGDNVPCRDDTNRVFMTSH